MDSTYTGHEVSDIKRTSSSSVQTGIYDVETTHAHDASRRAAPVMCALRMRVGHVEQTPAKCQSSRTTTNVKSEHNLYMACEDSQQRAFYFCTFSCSRLALLASLYIDFVAFSFSCQLYYLCLSQCCQPSAAFSTRLCKTRTLRRTNRVVLYPSSIVKKRRSSVLHR